MRVPWGDRGTKVRLTQEQWLEVAQASASDYHDWMDAMRGGKRKGDEIEVRVDQEAADWIAERFGEDVLA